MPGPEFSSGESSTDRGLNPGGMAVHWTWFIALLLAELGLALTLPELGLTKETARTWPISSVAAFAPVILNFGSLPDADPSVPVYLAITLLLTPFKVLFWVLWLRSDFGMKLSVFVPSPRRSPDKSVGDFVLDRRSGPQEEPRAGAFSIKGFVYSIVLAVLFIAFAFMYLNWGWELADGKTASLPSIGSSYRDIAQGGFSMWASWAPRNVVGAFFLAVVVMIIREYVLLFRRVR